jgi:hypothetical protein
MSVSNLILASTLQHISKEAKDALKVKYRFWEFASKNKALKEDISGRTIVLPVVTAEHSAITYHDGEGYEVTDESVSNILRNAEFEWCFMTAPIALDAKTKAINSGSNAIIDIYGEHVKSTIQKMGKEINAQALYGGVARSTLSTLHGESGITTGFLEGVAPASQTNVVGGLSKATYNVPGWTNAWATAGGAFGTASAGRIAMDSIQTQLMSRGSGDKPFDIVIMSEACFALYRNSLSAQERFVDAKELDGGNLHLMYGGAPVVPDLAMNNTTSRSGDNIFSAYFLSSAGIGLYMLPSANFKVVERGIATGTAVETWQVQVGIQLGAKHLGSLGVLTNADA